jgi:hypothetical protein
MGHKETWNEKHFDEGGDQQWTFLSMTMILRVVRNTLWWLKIQRGVVRTGLVSLKIGISGELL